jgi:hypothetical protein
MPSLKPSATDSLNACAINAPAVYIGNRPTVSESDTAISSSLWRDIDESVSDVLPFQLRTPTQGERDAHGRPTSSQIVV